MFRLERRAPGSVGWVERVCWFRVQSFVFRVSGLDFRVRDFGFGMNVVKGVK